MTINFYQKSAPNRKGEALIYLFVSINGKRIKLSTGQKLEPKYWDNNRQQVKKSYPACSEFNKYLTDIKSDILAKYQEYLSEDDTSLTGLKESFKEVLSHNITDDNKDFLGYYEKYLSARSKEVKATTLKRFKTLKTVLKEYIRAERKGKTLLLDDITLEFADSFSQYLLSKGLLNDTVAKYFKTLKTFMKWAEDRDYHSNDKYKRFAFSEKARHDIVTLTEQELTDFLNFDFSRNKRLERVRDVFCFQTYTLQRWGDVNAFNKDNIEGNKWIFDSIKTGKRISLSLVGWASPALTILKKYDFSLPRISQQKFNYYLKEALKMAGIDEKIKITRKSGINDIIKEDAKFNLCTSHTARRTGITILLLKNMPATTVMEISGHSDIRTMMKYVNVTTKDVEDALIKIKEGLYYQLLEKQFNQLFTNQAIALKKESKS